MIKVHLPAGSSISLCVGGPRAEGPLWADPRMGLPGPSPLPAGVGLMLWTDWGQHAYSLVDRLVCEIGGVPRDTWGGSVTHALDHHAHAEADRRGDVT